MTMKISDRTIVAEIQGKKSSRNPRKAMDRQHQSPSHRPDFS
jgi:hypothetical protein